MYTVLKFGGKSFSTPALLEEAASIIRSEFQADCQPYVVFSAMRDMTASLEQMARHAAKGQSQYIRLFDDFCGQHIRFAREVLPNDAFKSTMEKLGRQHAALKAVLEGVYTLLEASPRTLDYILSFGEYNACLIVEAYLAARDLPVLLADSRQLIRTDHQFGSAEVDQPRTSAQVKAFAAKHPGQVVLVPGFTGATQGGLFTTLGKGASDYTAAILASALQARSISIWSTVDGIMSADPERVQAAMTIPHISYAEALEMAQAGSKRIFPKAIATAGQADIPIVLANICKREVKGTHIGRGPFRDARRMIKGITLRSELALCNLSGIAEELLFKWLEESAKGGHPPILQIKSYRADSWSFVFEAATARKAQKLLQTLTKSLPAQDSEWRYDISLISITGDEMKDRPGVFGRMFDTLGKNGINVLSLAKTGEDQTISAVIPARDEDKALHALHERFFLSERQIIHLFLAGTGLIGGTLLQQLAKQKEFLFEERLLDIRLIGLSNSRQQHFDAKGLDLEHWKEKLQELGSTAGADLFIRRMLDLNLPNSIFIDCTPGTDFTELYSQCLQANISISTPNKLAASGPYPKYLHMKNLARRQGVKFAFETNVGAGLPVINTLNDLIQSGDRIMKIEGVLSGSLSYIFNRFQQGGTFSEAVEAARSLGLTEPDPRDDLFGTDFRRKLVILAREAGWAIDLQEVQMLPYLSPECLEADSVADFMQTLRGMDPDMDILRERAVSKRQVWRMVGEVQEGKASLSMVAVDGAHPFYSLDGSDNMIVFTSERYQHRPLVIRGPGAGAEVTAAGIFAEIISISNSL